MKALLIGNAGSRLACPPCCATWAWHPRTNPHRPRSRAGLVCLALLMALGGHLQAGAAEPALHYEQRASLQETLEATLAASGLPVLKPWHQVAPFLGRLRAESIPQLKPGLEETYKLLDGGQGTWRQMAEYRDGYTNTLDLSGISEGMLKKEPSVYLRRTIVAQQPTPLRVFLGCDVPFTVWLNGQPLYYAGAVQGYEPGSEMIDVPLAAGENALVIKVQITRQPCRFFFLADFGDELTEQLVDRLAADFPTQLERGTGYRLQAARQSSLAEEQYWRLAEIPLPEGVMIEGGGLDFLPDGRLAVCTRRGFVYLVDGLAADDPSQATFQRFASGLHEPLGLGVIDGQVLVVNRGEVTRLLDTDGDDAADRFETVSNAWGISGNYHEYAYGLPQDEAGNLYVALNLTFGGGPPASEVPYRGCVVRITPEGDLEPVACGLRSPNGIGRNAEGDIFVTDNQGDWVAACPLYHVEPGRYFGHPSSRHWYGSLVGNKPLRGDEQPPRTLPAVWFPYEELCQSATDIVCDTTDGRFGPFAGQLLVGEMTKGLVARVQLEKVNGKFQGTCFLLRRGLGAVNRLTFGPDGRLYFARVNRGWGGGGLGEGLARLEFTGRTPLEIERVHLKRDGFVLHFTTPLAAGEGDSADDYALRQYAYNYWETYGSPAIDRETIAVERVLVADDRRSVRLWATSLKEGKVCHIAAGDLVDEQGQHLLHRDAFYTLNELPR